MVVVRDGPSAEEVVVRGGPSVEEVVGPLEVVPQ